MSTPPRARFVRYLTIPFAVVMTAVSMATIGVGPAAAIPPGQPGELWIPEVNNDTIAIMDTATNKITQRINIPSVHGGAATRPAVLALSGDGTKMYTDNFGVAPLFPSVSIVDTKTKAVRTIPVFSTPLGIFTAPNGKEIMIPELGGTIEVLDIATDTIVRRFHYLDAPAGAFPGPDGLVYVGFVSGMIAAIDPRDGHFVKPPIWSGGLATFWYNFTKDGKKLYTDTVNSIGVIDVEAWKLIKTIPTREDGVGGLLNPGAFVSEISHDGKKIYVTRFGGGGIMVFSTETDQLITTLPMEGDQIGVAFSGDGNRVYITDIRESLPTPIGEGLTFMNLITFGINNPPGQVHVYDVHTDQLIEKVPTEATPGVPFWIPKR